MKADIYSSFLTDKVKAFPTKKGMSPFVIGKRVLRKAAPLLLCSAMVASGCIRSSQRSEAREDEWSQIYKETVEKYRLTALMDKEPLPKRMIDEMIVNPNAPALKDVNFNHSIENTENFWEIVKNGIAAVKEVQGSDKLSYNQKKEYQITAYKMLSSISRVKETVDEIDLSDYNNMKAFLYFEKVLAFKDNYGEVLESQPGWIDERTEIFGRHYKDLLELEKKASKHPGAVKFAQALYNCNERFIITYKDSLKANEISREMLKGWMEKQNVTDKGLWYLTDTNEDAYANAVCFWYRRGSTVALNLGVDAKGDLGDGDYSPIGTTIIHELQHVMQKAPKSAEEPKDNKKSDAEIGKVYKDSRYEIVSELGPTLCSLALEDQIYKKIHNIDENKLLDWGKIDVSGHKVELGEVAVWFNKMLKKYPHASIDKVVGENEVMNQLERWGNGNQQAVSRESFR